MKDPGLSIDMNFEAMEGLIGNRGVSVLHEIGLQCTCYAQNAEEGFPGHSSSTCNICYGLGTFWRDPVSMFGIIEPLTVQKQVNPTSVVQTGTNTFSPSTYVREISDFDRITLLQPFPLGMQVITRGVSGSSCPRPSELAESEDFLFHEAGSAQAIWVEDSAGNVYRYPDYCLSGRRICWSAALPIGTKYTIKYSMLLEYIVWATPELIFDRERKIGQRVQLEKIVAQHYTRNAPIRPPWQERLDDNAFEQFDSYTTYDSARPKIEPSR